jgi:uncharacterized protein YlaI
MSLNQKGPITIANLNTFAIATAFRLWNRPWHNARPIWCKICGTFQKVDEATSVHIIGANPPKQSVAAYLCPDCYKIITDAHADGRVDPISTNSVRRATKNAMKAGFADPLALAREIQADRTILDMIGP